MPLAKHIWNKTENVSWLNASWMFDWTHRLHPSVLEPQAATVVFTAIKVKSNEDRPCPWQLHSFNDSFVSKWAFIRGFISHEYNFHACMCVCVFMQVSNSSMWWVWVSRSVPCSWRKMEGGAVPVMPLFFQPFCPMWPVLSIHQHWMPSGKGNVQMSFHIETINFQWDIECDCMCWWGWGKLYKTKSDIRSKETDTCLPTWEVNVWKLDFKIIG